MKFGIGLAALLAASWVGGVTARAESMVFTSWGGTTQQAQKKDWADPFTKKTGIKVIQDGPTNYGKFKAMVESGNVSWDVVDVEYDFAVRAAKDGLLTKLTLPASVMKSIDPRFLTPYATGSFYYAFVLAYKKGTWGAYAPRTLADLFNTKKFPGKRAFYKWSAPGVLEAALLADGVPPGKLYPLDLNRAFRKLDSIKSNIVWWGSGAQSQQLLASGEAPIGLVWNGRVDALQKSGAPVAMSWDGNLTTGDMLVVPKGAPHVAAAMKFIAYATSAKAQAAFAADSGYAPINTGAEALMAKHALPALPDHHARSHVDLNMQYWANHRTEIANRWYAWQTK